MLRTAKDWNTVIEAFGISQQELKSDEQIVAFFDQIEGAMPFRLFPRPLPVDITPARLNINGKPLCVIPVIHPQGPCSKEYSQEVVKWGLSGISGTRQWAEQGFRYALGLTDWVELDHTIRYSYWQESTNLRSLPEPSANVKTVAADLDEELSDLKALLESKFESAQDVHSNLRCAWRSTWLNFELRLSRHSFLEQRGLRSDSNSEIDFMSAYYAMAALAGSADSRIGGMAIMCGHSHLTGVLHFAQRAESLRTFLRSYDSKEFVEERQAILKKTVADDERIEKLRAQLAVLMANLSFS